MNENMSFQDEPLPTTVDPSPVAPPPPLGDPVPDEDAASPPVPEDSEADTPAPSWRDINPLIFIAPGSQESISVGTHDRLCPGGAPIGYIVTLDYDGTGNDCHNVPLHFQAGPVAENGTNGLTNEVLLAIVADRLEHFQKGPFPCGANEEALGHVRKALAWLFARTRDRVNRGVESLNQT